MPHRLPRLMRSLHILRRGDGGVNVEHSFVGPAPT